MDRRRFRKLMEELLGELPEDFANKIENVAFIVESRPSDTICKNFGLDEDEMLLGLYQGNPLPLRSPVDYAGVLPDKIVIYQNSIEAEACGDEKMIRKVLRRTILHEIAHYFGISDKRLLELKAY